MRRAIAVIASLVALLAACGPEQDTRVHLYLTDFPIDDASVTGVLVTFTHIEVFSEDRQEWLTVVEYGSEGREFDLLTLQNGTTEELGAFNLDPGVYGQIRLHLTPEHRIEVDEGNGPEIRPLKIPSGVQTGVKLVREFTVTGDGPTSITVDFDAEKSVSHNRGQGYMLRPTIKIIETRTNREASKWITAAEGGEVHLIGRAVLRIPPRALRRDTEITIRAVEIAGSRAARLGLLPGTMIELGPDGLSFDRPAELSLVFDPAALPPGMSPDSLIVLRHDDGQPWAQMASTVASDPFTVTASVEHFTEFSGGFEVDLICPPDSERIDDPGNIDHGECRPVDTLTLDRVDSNGEDLEFLLYDNLGKPIDVREMDISVTSDDGEAVEVIPREENCGDIDSAGDCDETPGCGWDGSDEDDSECVRNPRFVTVIPKDCTDVDPNAAPSVVVSGSVPESSAVPATLGLEVISKRTVAVGIHAHVHDVDVGNDDITEYDRSRNLEVDSVSQGNDQFTISADTFCSDEVGVKLKVTATLQEDCLSVTVKARIDWYEEASDTCGNNEHEDDDEATFTLEPFYVVSRRLSVSSSDIIGSNGHADVDLVVINVPR